LIRIFKNQPVRFGFGFISLKLKNQTKPNQTKPKKQKKPSQTEKNRTEPKPVGLSRFGFFKSVWLLFFNKNQTENDHPYLQPTIKSLNIYPRKLKLD
jgi:hypothetical protein